jgi:hypothetical protein
MSKEDLSGSPLEFPVTSARPPEPDSSDCGIPFVCEHVLCSVTCPRGCIVGTCDQSCNTNCTQCITEGCLCCTTGAN